MIGTNRIVRQLLSIRGNRHSFSRFYPCRELRSYKKPGSFDRFENIVLIPVSSDHSTFGTAIVANEIIWTQDCVFPQLFLVIEVSPVLEWMTAFFLQGHFEPPFSDQ